MSHKVLKLLIHISINLVLHIIDGLEDKIYLVVTHVDIGQGRCWTSCSLPERGSPNLWRTV